ncbi:MULTISPECIES: hypothetical protein [unclassified Luteococcus]
MGTVVQFKLYRALDRLEHRGSVPADVALGWLGRRRWVTCTLAEHPP